MMTIAVDWDVKLHTKQEYPAPIRKKVDGEPIGRINCVRTNSLSKTAESVRNPQAGVQENKGSYVSEQADLKILSFTICCVIRDVLPACWIFSMLLLSSADFFKNYLFHKVLSGTQSEFQTMDSDQGRRSVDPDRGPNCLQRL